MAVDDAVNETLHYAGFWLHLALTYIFKKCIVVLTFDLNTASILFNDCWYFNVFNIVAWSS